MCTKCHGAVRKRTTCPATKRTHAASKRTTTAAQCTTTAAAQCRRAVATVLLLLPLLMCAALVLHNLCALLQARVPGER